MHKAVPIAGKFRGRILSRILRFCGYLRKFSTRNLGMWRPLALKFSPWKSYLPSIRESFLPRKFPAIRYQSCQLSRILRETHAFRHNLTLTRIITLISRTVYYVCTHIIAPIILQSCKTKSGTESLGIPGLHSTKVSRYTVSELPTLTHSAWDTRI